jgi:pyruvate ferredoxin oxidoreductase delta subunit
MKKNNKANLLPIMPAGTSKKFKTGSWRFQKPEINKNVCIKCMQCVNICPDRALSLNKKKNKIEIDENYCKGCGICANECPVKAIKMKNI